MKYAVGRISEKAHQMIEGYALALHLDGLEADEIKARVDAYTNDVSDWELRCIMEMKAHIERGDKALH